MTRYWGVSTGSYSDYSVSYVFEARADAIAYAAKLNGVSVDDMTLFEDGQQLEGERREKWFNSVDFKRLRPKLFDMDAARVEEFDFYRAGEQA